MILLGHQGFKNESIAKGETASFQNLNHERQIKINKEVKESWMPQRQWRKQSKLLNTKGIKEENTREDRKYFEMDEKRNHKYRNYGMQLK